MDTLRTGSEPRVKAAVRACPVSWNATVLRSFGFITRLFFSSPATTFSIAASKSACPTFLALVADREEGRLVDEVREVGPDEAGRTARHLRELHALVQLHGLGVYAQDGLASDQVGPVHEDLAVEAARPQQGGVEDVGPVGGGQDDQAARRVEAVHLDEELVQSLLALVVAAHRAVDPALADRVELVDEYDAGRLLAGLLE
jgi:hypothetical protein